MPRDNEPWVKVKIGARRSGKIAALPSDAARLGYFYTLLEAKVQRHMGVFDNRAHFVEVLGRFGRFLPDYLAVGLAHEAPGLCPECSRRNPGITPGEIVIHDFQREQRDPTATERQQRWRAEGNGVVDGEETAMSRQPASTTASRRNGVVDATVTADSRAPESTATRTGTRTTRERINETSIEGGARAERPVDPPAGEAGDLPW
jgi:hypothetical protein